jgi:LPXTG-motif cell wall-anchored protein
MKRIHLLANSAAVLPVAAVIALSAGSGTALAGGHPGSHPSCSPSVSPKASASPTASESPSMSPSASPTMSPTESPEATLSPEPEAGKGGGTTDESPSASPQADQGQTLPQTGATTALGGLGAAGTIGSASYLYYRSKKSVLDALRHR